MLTLRCSECRMGPRQPVNRAIGTDPKAQASPLPAPLLVSSTSRLPPALLLNILHGDRAN